MGCIFCSANEPHSEDLLLCGNCVAGLILLSPEQIKELHNGFIAKGQMEKAEVLERILMGDKTNGRQSKTYFKKRIDGKRPARFAGADKRASLRPTPK